MSSFRPRSVSHWWLPLLAVALAPTAMISGPPGWDSVRSLTEKNCLACHNSRVSSGQLDLERFTTPPSEADREAWEKVVQRIRTGEMPPKGAPRPSAPIVKSAIDFLEAEFARLDRSAKPNPGRVTARRLNRTEYNNTVRDLLGVDLRPADSFPPDDTGYGFDNIADVLSVSPALTERYLKAAEQLARAAIFGVTAPKPALIRHEPWYVDFSTTREVKFDYDKTGMSLPSALHVMHRITVEGDYDIAGLLRGTRPDGSEPLQVAFWVDGKLVNTVEYPVPDGGEVSGQRRQFRLHLLPGDHWMSASFLNIYDGLPPAYKGPNPSKLPQPKPRRQPVAVDGFPRHATTAFFVSNLEVTGPFNPKTGPSAESLRRIYTCGHTDGRHQRACERKILRDFARRAYRRPVTALEVKDLTAFVDLARANGDSFEEGLCLAIQKVLVSPHFLFRTERGIRSSSAGDARLLSQHELATRISYFLWATTPDDDLLRAADRGELRNQQLLTARVRRMLADPRSKALTENFGGQWLQFRALESHLPDRKKFQQYTEYTRLSLQRETELFLDHIVREDRSVLELLDAKYSFLNQRLAEYYGIDGVQGHDFRKVDLTGSPRAGVLTQGSVLTVSSYANRTSPVLRGKWILENLLNSPPPPPPPDVPNIDEAAVGATGSLRKQMETHRSNVVCSSCHSRMDPLGFGLENFDAIGQWRTKDGNFEIDSSGELPDGRSFRRPEELVAILRSDAGVFTEAVVDKLMTYALGRGVEPFDRRTVKSIAQNAAKRDYRFSAFVLGIINSTPFQQQRTEDPK